MKKTDLKFGILVVFVFAVIGSAVSVLFSRFIDFSSSQSSETTAPKTRQNEILSVSYNPPLLQDAPKDIKDAIMLGYNLMTDTRNYAAGNVGNKLDCSSCHFYGGITEGGRNGGLSLVGVAAAYPKFRKRQDYAVDLIARTNDCFERSMNGKPLPPESNEMIALVTYYQWISKGLPIYEGIPWLGVELIKTSHTPEPANGSLVFAQQCAVCHGNDGQGTLRAPPLWGNGSFNDGAGMNRPETMSAFVFLNMPRTNPSLASEQSLDVAAFVSAQPRPHFATKKK